MPAVCLQEIYLYKQLFCEKIKNRNYHRTGCLWEKREFLTRKRKEA